MNPTLTSLTPFVQYAPALPSFDECKTPTGGFRPGWQSIAEFFNSAGPVGLNDFVAESERFVRESGATFSAVGDSEDQSRPWQLSIVPLVFDATSWGQLEVGLQQRMRVLEVVLSDFLGPQRLIKERIVPAELLWSNPNFKRAYHELPPAGGLRLHVTSTDLARDDKGSWWVTGDRTRAPSGLGYLLENRILTSRLFPKLIRQSNVRRLASFFDLLRSRMRSLAPRKRDNPRVAILTPGDNSYRHFEDTYLARYLGYTLVQGRDLAVRGNKLNLKTLGGLLPIEVLWRHVSDEKCDPLELDPLSLEGVTGLLQTIRGGSVAVANCIGSTLVQMPALLPFLPAASRFLLSEELLLPNIATYWCGGEKEKQYVLANLDSLVLRPAMAVTAAKPMISAEMSLAAKKELVAAIQANPHNYVAQQQCQRSTTPVWHQSQLDPWHVALRSFHVHSLDGVDVLPGGFVRISPNAGSLDHSITSGQLGQDCWVIDDKPVDQDTTLLPPPGTLIRLTRSGAELPSRVAENLFWLGRNVERAESTARLLRSTLVRLAGETNLSDLKELPRLTAALAAVGQIEPDYAIEGLVGSLPPLDRVLPSSLFDRNPPRGLQMSVLNAAEKASAVRDRISLDAYQIVMRIKTELTRPLPAHSMDIGSIIETLNQLIRDLLAFAGLASESITRTHGWRFLQLGRRIERAYQTTELLAATLVHSVSDERSLFESVLEATDSLMTYRTRYLLLLQPAPVLDLLITDQTNPRSIAFQVQAIVELVAQMPVDAADVTLGADQKAAEHLSYVVRKCDAYELAQADANGLRRSLGELLQELIECLPALSDAISARYLIHTGQAQTLTGRSAAN